MKVPKNHIKGNRGDHSYLTVNQEKIEQIRKQTRDLVSAGRPPAYTNGYLMAVRIASYIEDTVKKGKPLTVAGLKLALGVGPKSYHKFESGEFDKTVDDTISGIRKDTQIHDWWNEKKKLNEDALKIYEVLISSEFKIGEERFVYFSEVLEKAKTILSLEREERLYDKGRVADIFAMKALDGWQEEEKKTDNNVLVIESEGATKALEMLGFRKDEK